MSLGFQFEVPVPLTIDGKPAPEHAKKQFMTVQLAVAAPPIARPMISDIAPTPLLASGKFVQ